MNFKYFFKISYVFVFFFGLSACGGDKFPKEEFIGNWKIQKVIAMQEDGETMDTKDLSKEDIVWDIKEDGSFDLVIDGNKIKSGTWEMNDEVKQSEGSYKYKLVKMTLDGGSKKMRLRTLKEGEMTLTEEVAGLDWKQYPSYDFVAK